jgi:hypothetical protein
VRWPPACKEVSPGAEAHPVLENFTHFTRMSIVRQRLRKLILEVTLSTIGHPMLRNGPINKHS